jgi:hypothetical protein
MIVVGALIGVAYVECYGQAQPNRAQNVPSPVRVAHGKSEMDGELWTILSVSAKSPYQDAFGTSVRPELKLECVQQKEEHRFLIVMVSGPHDYTPNDYDRLRVKLDDEEPEEEGWYELSDHRSWRHDSYPNTTDLEFLKKILSAKTMLIEFHPFMRSSVVEAKFDVSGLRREFDKYVECKPGPARP